MSELKALVETYCLTSHDPYDVCFSQLTDKEKRSVVIALWTDDQADCDDLTIIADHEDFCYAVMQFLRDDAPGRLLDIVLEEAARYNVAESRFDEEVQIFLTAREAA